MDFVEGGKGLFALHCASNCFRNSDKYTALVGGRFLRHNTGTFRAKIIDAQHPAMRGLSSFESWDETYVHDQLAPDIRVLMVREEQGGYEPYTWVRDQGKGRVFYTALGHDEHTWKAEGFQKLLEQGLRWCAGKIAEDKDVKPFEYVEANVPFYPPGEKWGTISDQAKRKMQLPLDPAESMKHMHLPEGFEVQLFASDPDIYRPICMAWDARGRLWIAETLDYPNDKQPPGKGHDRIVILEDTKGTGKADKFTVFAEKLSIPTSMTFARGGVIVTQAPETLFLKDTDGDDKADVRETLFRGWGVHDTHAGPSNLRYGFDNWMWGTVGYSGFNGTIGGKDYRFSQGICRMKPDGSDLEFLSSTSNNTWGLGLSETGEVFASTANNQHSVFLGVPNRYFEAVRGWHGAGSVGIEDHKKFHPVTDKIRQVDWHGGFTAAAGHALYTAHSFPEEYWNRAAFVCEPTGHLVHVDWLTPQGSGFVAKDGWNILASDDEWTAPVCAEVGPDGALWVIDWYNYIVQHNPTPKGFDTGKGGAYVTPLRDKTHGRIYRIVYKGAKPSPQVDFSKADEKELVATLSHENMWQRMTAQRLLVERGKADVVPQLAALVKDGKSAAGAFHCALDDAGPRGARLGQGRGVRRGEGGSGERRPRRSPRRTGGDAAHGRGCDRHPRRQIRGRPGRDGTAGGAAGAERNAGVKGNGRGRDDGGPRPEERRRPLDSFRAGRRRGAERHGFPAGRSRRQTDEGCGIHIHQDDPRGGRTLGASGSGRRGVETPGGLEIGRAGVRRAAAGGPGGGLAAGPQADPGRCGLGRFLGAGREAATVRRVAISPIGEALGPGEADGGYDRQAARRRPEARGRRQAAGRRPAGGGPRPHQSRRRRGVAEGGAGADRPAVRPIPDGGAVRCTRGQHFRGGRPGRGEALAAADAGGAGGGGGPAAEAARLGQRLARCRGKGRRGPGRPERRAGPAAEPLPGYGREQPGEEAAGGGRRIAESGSPKGGGRIPAGVEAARRRRPRPQGLRAELRQVPSARRPRRQHRPRPDRHGRPRARRPGHRHPRPQPLRRGQLPPVHDPDQGRPGADRAAACRRRRRPWNSWTARPRSTTCCARTSTSSKRRSSH